MEFIYPFSDFLHFQASFANRSLINTGSDFPLRYVASSSRADLEPGFSTAGRNSAYLG